MTRIGNLTLARLAGIFLLAALLSSASAAPGFIEQTPLWTAGQDGYHTYRIPALLVTAKGSVLAFCEGRKTGSGDHGDVDLIMKRSTDGGRTWSPHAIVHEEGGDAKITIGNPCPVVDTKTGTIWLPFNRDNKAVFITSSTDDGKTWSKLRDISATTMKPDWDWVATGPGIGIQLTRGAHKGRLVIPSDHKRALASKQPEWNSHMMFSDDSGATWQISAPIQAGGNECQLIERADGSLLVNTRMQGEWQGLRGIATSTDGGATWSAIAQEKQLPCPKCQGSLLRADEKRLLFSNPFPPEPKDGKPSGARVRMTVRSSTDDGKTWPIAKRLHEGPSAYSSLARLPDGTILCLYEGGKKRAYETLRLARFNLEWLTQETIPPEPAAARADGFEELFDGKSFTGWEHNGNWVIEDGAFYRKDKGGPLTYTVKPVPDDFELRFEWRVSKGCNSGVYYRPGQYEYQVLDNVNSPYGENPRQAAASLFFCMAPSKDASKPLGEWNEGRVVCKGTVIQHWLNGGKVIDFDYTDPKWAKEVELLRIRGADLSARGGKLWLQDHGADVWFRNLRLRTIPPEERLERSAFAPMSVSPAALEKENARVQQMLKRAKGKK